MILKAIKGKVKNDIKKHLQSIAKQEKLKFGEKDEPSQ